MTSWVSRKRSAVALVETNRPARSKVVQMSVRLLQPSCDKQTYVRTDVRTERHALLGAYRHGAEPKSHTAAQGYPYGVTCTSHHHPTDYNLVFDHEVGRYFFQKNLDRCLCWWTTFEKRETFRYVLLL